MEVARVTLRDDRYDEVVHPPSLREGGDLEFVVKDHATQGGLPGVAITFTVQLPDGTIARAQAVTTARNFLACAAVVRGRMAFLGIDPGDLPPSTPSPN